MQCWLYCLEFGFPRVHFYTSTLSFYSYILHFKICENSSTCIWAAQHLHTEDQRHASGSHLEKWDLNSNFNAFKRRLKPKETVHTKRMENPQGKPVEQEWQTDTAFSVHVIVISHYCCLLQQQTNCSGWSCLCKLIFFFSNFNLSLVAWPVLFVQRDTQHVPLFCYL